MNIGRMLGGKKTRTFIRDATIGMVAGVMIGGLIKQQIKDTSIGAIANVIPIAVAYMGGGTAGAIGYFIGAGGVNMLTPAITSTSTVVQ